MTEFGWRFREIQKALGVTQAKLAEELEIGISSLKNYMKGDREPGLDLIETLCQDFRVSPDWLLLGKGGMFYTSEQSMDQKHSILGGLENIDAKKRFLAKSILDILEEIEELGKADEATNMLSLGKIDLDQFFEGMKRLQELDLTFFALGALKAVIEFMAVYTKEGANNSPLLPEGVINKVKSGLLSGEKTIENLREVKKEIIEEWKKLSKSK